MNTHKNIQMPEGATALESDALNIQPKSAAALLKEYLTSAGEGDSHKTASFFAEGGFIDAPYVVSLGLPSKIEGPAAIQATMENLFQNAPDFHFTSMKVILETPGTVVAQYESEASFTNGRAYKQLYLGVVTAEDGKITSHTEYLNTIPFVEAFFPNGLKDLITTK